MAVPFPCVCPSPRKAIVTITIQSGVVGLISSFPPPSVEITLLECYDTRFTQWRYLLKRFSKNAGMFYFSKTECSDQGKGYNLYPVNMIAMMS